MFLLIVPDVSRFVLTPVCSVKSDIKKAEGQFYMKHAGALKYLSIQVLVCRLFRTQHDQAFFYLMINKLHN